jgi:predicted nucleic acid-binding protein
LPLVDSIIAASAKAHDAVLVHRDPHLRAIPTERLKQLLLPAK